jgi:MoaD family protein
MGRLMRIRVKGYLTYSRLVGLRQLEVGKSTTVRSLLEELKNELGTGFVWSYVDGQGKKRHVSVLINGRHCSHLPAGLDTILADGDQVYIFPPVAGG